MCYAFSCFHIIFFITKIISGQYTQIQLTFFYSYIILHLLTYQQKSSFLWYRFAKDCQAFSVQKFLYMYNILGKKSIKSQSHKKDIKRQTSLLLMHIWVVIVVFGYGRRCIHTSAYTCAVPRSRIAGFWSIVPVGTGLFSGSSEM